MESLLICTADEWKAWAAERQQHSKHFDVAVPQLPTLAVWIDTETAWDNPVVYYTLFTQPDIARTLEKMDS